MRILIVWALVVALGGCKSKRAPAAEPAKSEATVEPNRDPYRNVTPQRIKKQVEDIQNQEDKKNDRLIEQAHEQQ